MYVGRVPSGPGHPGVLRGSFGGPRNIRKSNNLLTFGMLEAIFEDLSGTKIWVRYQKSRYIAWFMVNYVCGRGPLESRILRGP